MPERPLLLFPQSSILKREKKGKSIPSPVKHKPSREDRIAKLDLQIRKMNDAFVSNSITGLVPEKVLVMEVVGEIKDFSNAIKNLGLEWMAEVEIDELPEDAGYERKAIGSKYFVGGKLKRCFWLSCGKSNNVLNFQHERKS